MTKETASAAFQDSHLKRMEICHKYIHMQIFSSRGKDSSTEFFDDPDQLPVNTSLVNVENVE